MIFVCACWPQTRRGACLESTCVCRGAQPLPAELYILQLEPSPRHLYADGRLIYNLMGAGEEVSFTRAWLIALGISNATDFQDVFKQAVQTVLIFLLLEPFIIPRTTWCAQSHCSATGSTIARH